FNLVIERLKELEVRASRYNQLASESRMLQTALEHLSQGVTAWSATVNPNNKGELRQLFLSVERIQRFQLTQWKSLLSALERATLPLGRIRSTLDGAEAPNKLEMERNSTASPEYSLAQLEQQLQRLIAQTRGLIERMEGQTVSATPQPEAYQPQPQPRPEAG